jgi:hypothetical protein
MIEPDAKELSQAVAARLPLEWADLEIARGKLASLGVAIDDLVRGGSYLAAWRHGT